MKTFMMSLFFLLIDESLICLLKSIFSLKDRVLNELEDAQRNILTLQNEVEEIKQQLQQKDEMIASMNRENLAIKADNKILENYNEELKTIQTKFLKLLSSKD